MATIDPHTQEGERIGMSRYCDHLERRIADLEAALASIIAIDDADGISANYCGCQPELKKAMDDARAAVAKARNT